MNVQSSMFSSSERLPCVVNLAVAPEPWLRWQRERLGQRMPKAVQESLGLFRARLHPEGTPAGIDGWWEIYDSKSADVAVADMVAQLEAAGWPVLARLLQRQEMLAQVRSGVLGQMTRANSEVLFARVEALLLMDQGPSEDLEERLYSARVHLLPEQTTEGLRFEEWVRGEARAAR